jgi:glyoxylase-like metal-dependent hydrolase (beta-lactamase superfamily II)
MRAIKSMDPSRRDVLQGGLTATAAAAGMAAAGETVFAKAAEAAAPAPQYDIFACQYGGPVTRKQAIALWNSGWDADGQISYFVWAVRAKDGGTVVVDTGANPVDAANRRVPAYTDPVEVLSRTGVGADNVRTVVISHMHWDHVGNIEAYLKAFPKAKVYVQKRELAFCSGPLAARKPIGVLFDPKASKVVAGLQGTGRLAVVDGDHRLAPGLDLFLAPGHTLGLQVLRVNTAKGPAIVGSDLAHLFQGLKDDTGSAFVMDMPAWLRSFDRIKPMVAADMIFPGHDVRMHDGYPEVAKGVTKLV